MSEFDEYIRQGDPTQKEKSELWRVAIGLQATDGLTVSPYLIDLAKQNIQGDITIDQVGEKLDVYYAQHKAIDDRTDEADKVSTRITQILDEKSFTFNPVEFIEIHRRLFEGIYDFAGKIRDYNITKKEWVLNGDTVYYAGANTIMPTLHYEFQMEKESNFVALPPRKKIERIIKFMSGVWQVHPFGEGNTRTTAVFIIKYLRSLGFRVDNDYFESHSRYFRNALVRANYDDSLKGIVPTMEFINRFFGNLLFGERHELRSRDLLIGAGDTVNDTVNDVNDTVNAANDTVNAANDTVNDASDTVNDANDTVNDADDTVNAANDTVNDTVFKLIKASPHITAGQIAKALNMGIATVKRHTRRLKDGGFIRRVGSDKTGHWEILKNM